MKRIISFIASTLMLSVSSLAADLKLAGLFTDHTVLQRDNPVPIWGWTTPEAEVTVEFAGQTQRAKADADGKWLATLNAMPTSTTGKTLTVRLEGTSEVIALSDVVVGDVWLCSGQSNMAFRMKRTENAAAEIAAANDPGTRYFRVQDNFSQQPASDVKGAWTPISPATAEGCSAVAYYFARAVREKHDVPIGLLVSSVGGTRIETWMEPQTLRTLGLAGRLLDQWKDISPQRFEEIQAEYTSYQQARDVEYPQAVRAARAEGKPVPPEPARPALRTHDCPGALHNGMIAPLKPYAIRGALWYQGESNVEQAAQYEKMQPALIADWRRAWGPALPFLFVQLPPHRLTHPSFREAQQRIWQNTPHTAMVITLDVGDAQDIHPARKRPVGDRLALAARAMVLGEAIEASGPIFKSLAIDGHRAIVSYTHVGQGLITQGESLKGFTIAGAEGKFVPADAVIDGATVIVSSAQVEKPVAVRYGWAFVPECTLSNAEGLPAAPFRSDSSSDKTQPVPQK